MICPSCGIENEEGAKFCQSCGGNMEGVSSSGGGPGPKAPPPPPPPTSKAPGQAPGSVNIDIGGWISKGFSETFSDFGNYILLGVVVGLVSAVTAMILAGPLFGGGLVLVRRKLRGQGQIDIGQVFSIGFEKFLPTFVLVFAPVVVVALIQMLPVIGQIIGIVAAGFLGPFWAIGLHYIMEENEDFMEAAKKSLDMFMKNPVMFWLFGLVAGIISGIGAVVCGIGIIITVPIGFVMYATMLEELFPKK
jgi:hypothetical protein